MLHKLAFITRLLKIVSVTVTVILDGLEGEISLDRVYPEAGWRITNQVGGESTRIGTGYGEISADGKVLGLEIDGSIELSDNIINYLTVSEQGLAGYSISSAEEGNIISQAIGYGANVDTVQSNYRAVVADAAEAERIHRSRYRPKDVPRHLQTTSYQHRKVMQSEIEEARGTVQIRITVTVTETIRPSYS